MRIEDTQMDEYWRDTYLLHSESLSFQKKVKKSVEYVNRFLDLGVKCYGSVSGGKDSTAMMHLIESVSDYHPSIGFVSVKDDMDFPGEMEYLRILKQEFGFVIDVLHPENNLWEIAHKHDFTEDIHSKGTAFSDDNFYGLLKEYQREHQYKGVFLGLRAEESNGRRFNRAKNGLIYYNEDWHQLVCHPLADWTGMDVMAYLVSREVPILYVYFLTKFVKAPHEIRKSWVLPSGQASSGQALWLKYYFPEIFQRLAAINPKMRAYV